MTAFEERITHYLAKGHHVQFGKIGYFSMKLKSRPVEDQQKIHAQSITFEKVNFRPTATCVL